MTRADRIADDPDDQLRRYGEIARTNSEQYGWTGRTGSGEHHGATLVQLADYVIISGSGELAQLVRAEES